MKRHGVALSLIIVFALVVAACSSGSGGGGDDVLGLGDRNLDRCSLISGAEAEQWLGTPVVEPAPSDGIDGEPDLVTCFYENQDNRASFFIQVYDGEVFFAEKGSASRAGETIDDLGEDAFIYNGAVRFLQNDWAASVARISGLMPDEDILEIARIMSSRLP